MNKTCARYLDMICRGMKPKIEYNLQSTRAVTYLLENELIANGGSITLNGAITSIMEKFDLQTRLEAIALGFCASRPTTISRTHFATISLQFDFTEKDIMYLFSRLSSKGFIKHKAYTVYVLTETARKKLEPYRSVLKEINTNREMLFHNKYQMAA